MMDIPKFKKSKNSRLVCPMYMFNYFVLDSREMDLQDLLILNLLLCVYTYTLIIGNLALQHKKFRLNL